MTVDDFGRLSTVADAQKSYLTGVTFNTQGLLSQLNLGNGNQETFSYNSRFQLESQSLLKSSTVLQKWDYGYGEINGSGALDTAKNNGQLGRIESFIGTAKQWTQKFQYDSIGRLKQAEERRGDNDALSYKQVFDFDRFGNLYRKTASNPTTGQEDPLPYTPIEDSDINRSTNRFATDTTYNEAGMVTGDDKFRDMAFSYDANGRMVKATRSETPDAWTVYDALGNRVAAEVNDVWTFMIYDAFGKLVAEYGQAGEGTGGVSYIQQDWQGSVRTVTNSNGFVISRGDYTAFGERISVGVGLRSTTQGYIGTSQTRQGYGLTEKDDGTGLDHTGFRKNEGSAGRWTSPDPYNGSMSPGDPQSFNRYSYVVNQPTNFVDPTGLLTCYGWWVVISNDGGRTWQNTGIFIVDYCLPDVRDGSGSGNGGNGGGGSSSVGQVSIPPKCAEALKKIGLFKKTQDALKNDEIIDVDKIQNARGSDYFGARAGDLTVGQYFDSQTRAGQAYTYRAATQNGRSIGQSGTYRRGGVSGMTSALQIHEALHRVQPKTSDLDVSLAKLLKVDTSGFSNASDALDNYFENGCN